MKLPYVALAAAFIFIAGSAISLEAQSISASKIPSRTGQGTYNGPNDSPGRPGGPSYGKPGQGGNHGHGRPPSGGQHRPGGNKPGINKPGGSHAPSVRPDYGGYDRRDNRFQRFRRNRDCWPNGCGDNYYGYYYDDPYKVQQQEAPRDQNITITIVEPEPKTYFSSGPFEQFDDPRDKKK